MELEPLILGHILMKPDLLKKLDINKDFFHDQKQRLIFREIENGNTDLALIAKNLEGKTKGIFPYCSRLLEGLAKTDSENVQSYINKIKKSRLDIEILKLINQGATSGHYDQNKIDDLYKQRKSLETPKEKYNLIDLGQVEPKPIDWLWYNKIPSGKLSLLVGDPGAGKSLLSLYMASIITNGKDWPDVKNPPGKNKGSVIILTNEDSLDDTVRVRADEMQADCSKIKILEGMLPNDKAEFFDVRKHIRILEQAIEKTRDVKMIIFDPITAYLGNTEGNKNISVRAALSPLAALADKHKLAIIGINHLNKDQAKKALYRSMGSVAFTSTARSVWLVQQDEDDTHMKRRFFSPLKANICKEPTTLAFSINGPIGRPKITFEPIPVDTTAEELLADEETKKRYSAINQAKKFLIESLKDGSLPATEIFNEAKENDISEATLNRTKSIIGIVSYKEKNMWYWRLKN